MAAVCGSRLANSNYIFTFLWSICKSPLSGMHHTEDDFN